MSLAKLSILVLSLLSGTALAVRGYVESFQPAAAQPVPDPEAEAPCDGVRECIDPRELNLRELNRRELGAAEGCVTQSDDVEAGRA